jgi:segregation and condensation protein A
MYQIKLERFSGPLDLLLQCVESENLAITDIALTEVADQYLKHLYTAESTSPGDMADFLVIAARLLLMKSKALLPESEGAEDENGTSLTDQLKLYKEFVDATKRLESIIVQKRFQYAREKYFAFTTPVFQPPAKDVEATFLRSLFEQTIVALEPFVRLPEKTLEKTVSIHDKVSEMKKLIAVRPNIRLSDLLSRVASRTEIVVSFMAILELMKENHVSVRQRELFGDIDIRLVS